MKTTFKTFEVNVPLKFSELKRALLKNLVSVEGIGPTVSNSTNPIPFPIATSCMESWQRLHGLLHQSITNVTFNLGKDKTVQSLLNLDNDSMNMINYLQSIKGKNDYMVGSFRPDLLILDSSKQDNYQTQICEINARFAINGYFISCYCGHSINQIYQNDKNYQNYLKNHNNSDWFEYPNPNQLLNNRFDLGNESNPIYVIKGKEHGWDVHILQHIYGSDCVKIITPNELIQHFDENNKQLKMEQIILELHQSELINLWQNNSDILIQIMENIESQHMLNDLRTILIAHNKRFLSILCNSDIMRHYIGFENASFLKENIVPTIAYNDNIIDIYKNDLNLDQIKNYKNDWLLKPSLLGKGEGIIFGDECTNQEWENKVNLKFFKDKTHVIQKCIKQKLFEFESIISNNDQPCTVQQSIVPTLLCIDDLYIGPGINRTSPSKLIALSRGGEMLMPFVTPN